MDDTDEQILMSLRLENEGRRPLDANVQNVEIHEKVINFLYSYGVCISHHF